MNLIEQLKQIPDSRSSRGKRHALWLVMCLTLIGVLCNYQGYRQNHEFLVRDLSLGNQLVYLKVNRRQFKCAKCQKLFSEDLKFVKLRRSYTKRLAEQVVKQVLSSNLKTIAEQYNLSKDIVERMLKNVAQEKLEEKPKELKKLGIDIIITCHKFPH